MRKSARGNRRASHRREEAEAAAASAPRWARRALAAVLLLYLALSTAYVFRLPVDAAPDESAHRVYVGWLAENRRLPVFDPADEQRYELHQPPLYYALCLPAYYAAGGGRDVARVTHAIRFVNVLLGLAVALLAFVFAGHLAPDRPWVAVGAAAFVAFLPMQLVLCASINNDVLSQALTTGALCLLVGQARAGRAPAPAAAGRKKGRRAAPAEWSAAAGKGFSARRMALVGVLAALALLTKSQAVFLVPVIWLGALAGAWNGDITLRRALGLAALATGVMLGLAGWWLARNQMLYGDPLAMGVFLRAFVGSRPTPEKMMAGMHLTPFEYIVQWVIWWTFRSFWGMFGPSAAGGFAFYPGWCYAVLVALTAAAVAGAAGWLSSRASAPWQRRALLAPGLLGGLVIASFVRFNFTFFQAQGRYLFPALALWAFLFVVGLTHHAPARARAHVTAALSGLMLLLAAWGLAVMGALAG